MRIFAKTPVEWTPGNIASLLSNPAWTELEKRVQYELEAVDVGLESPEVFGHGVAVGQRRAFRLVLCLPHILRDEADGKSPVKALK